MNRSHQMLNNLNYARHTTAQLDCGYGWPNSGGQDRGQGSGFGRYGGELIAINLQDSVDGTGRGSGPTGRKNGNGSGT